MTALVNANDVGATYTETSLALADGLTREEWAREFRMLLTLWGGIPWYIGDAILYAEQHYDDWEQELPDPIRERYKLSYLKNLAWIARTFPPSRRRETLAHGHHREVAGLTHREQEWWLDAAEEDDLSTADLRHRIREHKAGRELPSARVKRLGDELAALDEDEKRAVFERHYGAMLADTADAQNNAESAQDGAHDDFAGDRYVSLLRRANRLLGEIRASVGNDLYYWIDDYEEFESVQKEITDLLGE